MKNILALLLLTALFTAVSAQEKYITTSDGVKLYVKVAGQGTPCLYIHGGPGSGSHWLEKFSGEMLEKNFKMIYLDQRGVCRSSTPADGNYSMERMVKDFEEVRTALGIKSWLTLGHSFGGILQMGYAERSPEVVKGMIMICCGLDLIGALDDVIPNACKLLGITDITPYIDKSVTTEERIQKFGELYSQLRSKNLFWKMGYSDYHSIELMNASFDDIPDWNKDMENKAMSVKDYSLDYTVKTSSMHMPVLFFYGKTDWMVGPNHYKSVHFPEMILWGSNVGHVPFIENKKDLEDAIVSYKDKYKL